MDLFEMIGWLQLIASWVSFALGVFDGIKNVVFALFDVLLHVAVHFGPWLIGLWVICQVGEWMFSAGKDSPAAEAPQSLEVVATQQSSNVSAENGAATESEALEEESPDWWTESETTEKEGVLA